MNGQTWAAADPAQQSAVATMVRPPQLPQPPLPPPQQASQLPQQPPLPPSLPPLPADDPNDDLVRLFAVSDLHVDAQENAYWLTRLSDTAYKRDAIIVAGDVSDDLIELRQSLDLLKSKFRDVFFTPGNHDLWVTKADRARGQSDSMLKLRAILKLCDYLGVHTRPMRVGNATAGVGIVPLLSWHHASWDPEPDLRGFAIPPVEQVMTDFRNCVWPAPLDPRTDSIARAVDALNDELLSAAQVSQSEPLVSFSHFLPRVELLPEKRFLTLPVLAKASGSDPLRNRVQLLRPTMHVFGHTHFGWDQTLDGTRFVQGALAYPGERTSRWHTLKVGDLGAEGPLHLWNSREGFAPHMHCRWSGYYEHHRREPERCMELAMYAAQQWPPTDERASCCMPDFSHEDGPTAMPGVRMLREDPAFVKPW